MPKVGDALIVLVQGVDAAWMHDGWLRFDRGRGVIIDLSEAVPWRRGDRVLMAHVSQGTMRSLSGVLREVVSPTRGYVVPDGPWRPGERREHIRVEFHVPCALSVDPAAVPSLVSRRVELSASGFRWFGHLDVQPGDALVLSVALDGASGTRLELPARAVRVGSGADGAELAGTFVAQTPEQVELLVDRVCRQRLAALGATTAPSSGRE
jgi:hypothetical protein